MTAITNLEKLLSGDESVKPVTRIEQIVKGIDIKPLTHFEQIVCGYDIPPMNRLEQIIKGLDVGGYRSREEYFWGEWASGHGNIGSFYTDGSDIWECILTGIPEDFTDSKYFDIIAV